MVKAQFMSLMEFEKSFGTEKNVRPISCKNAEKMAIFVPNANIISITTFGHGCCSSVKAVKRKHSQQAVYFIKRSSR